MAFAAPPVVREVGAFGEGTGNCAPGIPTGTATGDLLLTFTESQGDEPVTDSDYTVLTEAHDAGGTTTSSRVTVLYKTAESASPVLTVSDPGDHIECVTLGIQAGTWDTGDPFDVIVTDTQETDDTARVIPGGTTTRTDCLIIYVLSGNVDPALTSGNRCTLGSNADITFNSTNEFDQRTSLGNGGTLCGSYGDFAAGGTFGDTSVTDGTSEQGGELHIAVCNGGAVGGRRVLVISRR